MALHALTEYLRYSWKAQGRHGTHSPFIYELVERVLYDTSPIKTEYLVRCPQVGLRYENLLSRIAAYYNYKHIAYAPAKPGTTVLAADMLVLNGEDPVQWATLLRQNEHLLGNESAVVVTGIHTSREHTDEWEALCALEQVRVSIDMYGVGMLLLRKEFKERQHFVLKY